MSIPEGIETPIPLTGWTPGCRARFLTHLSEKGNVRQAAARCGLSAQSAYKLRRRDALFARGWDAALLLARDHAEQVMADRALEGVEEPIFFRGEQIGSRRRYDNRLLLAHMARLDALAYAASVSGAAEDAEQFDELLALVAGEDAAAPQDSVNCVNRASPGEGEGEGGAKGGNRRPGLGPGPLAARYDHETSGPGFRRDDAASGQGGAALADGDAVFERAG